MMIKHLLTVLTIAVWICLSPGISGADSVGQVVGIAAKDTDAFTWRHLLSPRFSQFSGGAYTTEANQNYLATFSLTAGCNGALCTTINPTSVLDPDQDGFLVGNNSLLTIAQIYGFTSVGGDRWNRIRVRSPGTIAGVVDGVATSPMLQSGFGPNDLAIGDTVTQAGTSGIQNIVPYMVSTGGAYNRFWSSLTAGFTGAANACQGCLATGKYISDGTFARAARGFDLDSGGGEQFIEGISLRLSGAGGSVPVSSTDPLSVSMGSPPALTSFFAIKRDNIAAVSVNLAFGFSSSKVSIQTPGANTAEVCVDWLGGTAVCPAANTAGDDRIAAGTLLLFDEFNTTSISVIASSGTQTIFVRAWK